MATVLETALQAKSIAPSITVDDVQKSLKFFEGLGFGVEERWEDNGVLEGVMLRAGEARIGLSQDDWKKGRDRKKGVGMRLSHRDRAGYQRHRDARESRRHQARFRAARH